MLHNIPHSQYHYFLHTNLSTYSPWRTKNPSLFFAARSRSVLAFFCKPSMMYRHSLRSLLNFSLSSSMARFIIASLMMFNSSLSAVPVQPPQSIFHSHVFLFLNTNKHKPESCNTCCTHGKTFIPYQSDSDSNTKFAVKLKI